MARRKKNKVVTKKPEISEFEGWSIGDLAWFCLKTEATPHQGEITNFYPKDKIAPAVSLNDITAGGHRVTLVKYIFETKKEAKASRPEYLKFWEDYKQ